MLYVAIYIIIGLVYAGVIIPKLVADAQEKYDSPLEKDLAPVAGWIIGVVLVAPFWPMALASNITKRFRKK